MKLLIPLTYSMKCLIKILRWVCLHFCVWREVGRIPASRLRNFDALLSSILPLLFSCNYSVAVFGCMNSKFPIKILSSLSNVSGLVYQTTDWVVVNVGFCYWANWWINSMLLMTLTCLIKTLCEGFSQGKQSGQFCFMHIWGSSWNFLFLSPLCILYFGCLLALFGAAPRMCSQGAV